MFGKRGYVLKGKKNSKSFRRSYNRVVAKNVQTGPSMQRGGSHL